MTPFLMAYGGAGIATLACFWEDLCSLLRLALAVLQLV